LIQTNRGIGYTFTDRSNSVRRSPVPVDHSGITGIAAAQPSSGRN
jgi:hypothetical protein